ncbi:hypothetical protein [Nannocystis sp. SCPEA4]|uniref:ORC-CDC6 family AAA ATPase n=1 Tax=Nannocystis sp. SCPEA4 TaxID=2996787 RepID=UPI00226FDE99|nr:hypothetical protein [Nannocystis sp. SCPEA4]MCY1053979.1 hypothetical protein [Nannocystis sp. SCPEA4]
MRRFSENPFSVTKAVDFTDDDILEYWVDFPGGYENLVNPTGPGAMLILGGKGSGKTHLMRFLSVPVQTKLFKGDIRQVTSSGFIGVYLPCGGLNASRFAGKHQEPEAWGAVFQYYMDLSLLQLGIATASLFVPLGSTELGQAAEEIASLFSPILGGMNSMERLCNFLDTERQQIDFAVNNAALTRVLNVQIRANPSELVFGGAAALTKYVQPLQHCRIAYLIDEFENLGADQQRYVNSLIREQRPPVSIRVGGRLYGVRTVETFSAGEPIREGSEYEGLRLDDRIRAIGDKGYLTFATSLCASRLRRHGIDVPRNPDEELRFFEEAFEDIESTRDGRPELDFVLGKHPSSEARPWIKELRKSLAESAPRGEAPEVFSEENIDHIVRRISVPESPLVERIGVHLLYLAWNEGRSLLDASEDISLQAATYLRGDDATSFAEQLRRWRADLTAQICRAYKQPVPYYGWRTLVDLSHGLPRNLLVILKQITNWAEFSGRSPFRGRPISRESQTVGIKKAAEWFLNDVAIEGDDGEILRGAARRLGQLFRTYRFAQKPSEVGVSTFSVDKNKLDDQTTQRLHRLVQWSLLVEEPRGHRDKNDNDRIDSKYQINRLLATYWEISTARRATLPLSAEECISLFDKSDSTFRESLAKRSAGMTPPFGRRGRILVQQGQQGLF